MLTERLVFRGAKPGTVRSGRIRFFLLNNLALLAAPAVARAGGRWLGVLVVPANVVTLVLLFLVRFVVADAAIYGAGATSAPPPKEPMRVIVGVACRDAVAQTDVNGATSAAGRRASPGGDVSDVRCSVRHRPRARQTGGSTHAQRFLPYRYDDRRPGSRSARRSGCPSWSTSGPSGSGTTSTSQVRVGDGGPRPPRGRADDDPVRRTRRASATRSTSAGSARTSTCELGEPIVVTVAPLLARSPHVVYTNILEALLRFVAVSEGAMLLHSACLELDGVGILISAAHRHRARPAPCLRMVREQGARFLSDDMTVLHGRDGLVCFPKPLTICHHTLRAIGHDELTAAEWRRLQLQSRLHSKEGRQFAMLLARLNIPIMGVNALTQYLVPPPKYTVDRLLPCEIAAADDGDRAVRHLPRRARSQGEMDRRGDAHAAREHRRRLPVPAVPPARPVRGDRRQGPRRAAPQGAGDPGRCAGAHPVPVDLDTDFGWADEIPRTLADDASNQRQLSTA